MFDKYCSNATLYPAKYFFFNNFFYYILSSVHGVCICKTYVFTKFKYMWATTYKTFIKKMERNWIRNKKHFTVSWSFFFLWHKSN